MAKKISSATIDKIIKANQPEKTIFPIKLEDKTIEIEINPSMNFTDHCNIANEIADLCYDVDGNYHPEFFDTAYNVVLIEHFTNLPVDIENLFNRMFVLCEFTTFMDGVIEATDPVGKIYDDARAIIERRNAVALHTSDWDEVANSLSTLLDRISDKVDKMGDLNQEDLKKLINLGSKVANIKDNDVVEKILKFRAEEPKQ